MPAEAAHAVADGMEDDPTGPPSGDLTPRPPPVVLCSPRPQAVTPSLPWPGPAGSHTTVPSGCGGSPEISERFTQSQMEQFPFVSTRALISPLFPMLGSFGEEVTASNFTLCGFSRIWPALFDSNTAALVLLAFVVAVRPWPWRRTKTPPAPVDELAVAVSPGPKDPPSNTPPAPEELLPNTPGAPPSNVSGGSPAPEIPSMAIPLPVTPLTAGPSATSTFTGPSDIGVTLPHSHDSATQVPHPCTGVAIQRQPYQHSAGLLAAGIRESRNW